MTMAGRGLPCAAARPGCPEVLPDACLARRGWDCRACVDACPGGALSLERGPVLDASRCLGCGVCDTACPVGAVRHPAAEQLLDDAKRLPRGPSLALGCRGAPGGPAAPGDAPRLRVAGCLSALGPEVLAALAAQGVRELHLPTGACADCSRGDKGGCLAESLDTARDLCGGLLEIHGHEPLAARGRAWPDRGTGVDHSRRALFRRLSPLTAVGPGPTLRGPDGRRGLLRKALAVLEADPVGDHVPTGRFRLGLVRLDGQCSACGACARACPTGALALDTRDGAFRLVFTPWKCLACGFCVRSCLPGGLFLSPGSTRQMVREPEVLARGRLAKCSRCGADMPEADGKHCTLCARLFRGV